MRVAATLHVLFNMDTPQTIPEEISQDAIESAKNFVEVCNQHVAHLAGRGVISEAIEGLQKFQKSKLAKLTILAGAHHQWLILGIMLSGDKTNDSLRHSNAAYSLLLSGKVLNLTVLNTMRKFRDRGNKAGAIEAWKLLQEKGLGKLIESKARRGTDMVSFKLM